jgi:O-methyltransferase involved in polyketide biosynthesis
MPDPSEPSAAELRARARLARRCADMLINDPMALRLLSYADELDASADAAEATQDDAGGA